MIEIKNKLSSRASSLFLMELIIAILFFCLAATACVQLFFKSHQLSDEAQVLNNAVNICSGAAEVISVSNNVGNSLVKKYYNEDMVETAKQDACYVMIIRTKEKNHMIYADISMRGVEDNQVIYSLDVCHNIKNSIRKECEQ